MKINIYVDKKYINKKNIKEAVEDYKKRCSKFVKVNLYYDLNEDLFLKSTSYNINVTTKGKYINSISFSNFINECLLNRIKDINIVFELNYKYIKNNICFSNVDIISSGFLYVMVLEQIYRSYKIINNEPYHK